MYHSTLGLRVIKKKKKNLARVGLEHFVEQVGEAVEQRYSSGIEGANAFRSDFTRARVTLHGPE